MMNMGYDDRRDWREEEYNRYCHEHRGYRMSREEFYRDHCDYQSSSLLCSQESSCIQILIKLKAQGIKPKGIENSDKQIKKSS